MAERGRMRRLRHRLGLLIALLLCLPAAGCSTAAPTESDVWMYAVSAGKADAILLGVSDAVCLIDAGYVRTRGKILAAMERMGVEKLDAVFLTHTDDDHADGLEWLAESEIPVGTWYASALYTSVKESKHPAVKAAAARGQEVVWLQAGDAVSLGGATLEVLAPAQLNEDKDDNNSLVMMLHSDEGRILLAGDMEFPEEGVLLQSGADVACDVLKVPNHADDDTCSETFVRAAAPDAAVICTDTREKSETPDPRVVASLQAVGAQVAVTQECTGGILVYLHQGTPSIEKIDLPQPATGVSIRQVIPGEDRIVLANDGETVSLEGWYLVSDRGNELYVFGSGAQLDANAELTLGTLSTDGTYDLLWDDEEVIHTSKNDVITLYDANGMEVSSMDNGC